MNEAPALRKKTKSTWLNIAVDYGPLLIFFLVYRHFAPSNHTQSLKEVAAVIWGTSAFMGASIIALIVSKLKIGHISPMLWLTTAMIIGFGAITLYTQNAEWIRHKPTAVYLLFGVFLLAGVWRGKSLLKVLLEAAFEGLDERGWWLLSRNWGVFFVFLAALNEGLNIKHGGQFYITMEQWIAAKLWLFMPLSFLFTFAHMPMLLRHGLAQDATEEVVSNPPHE